MNPNHSRLLVPRGRVLAFAALTCLALFLTGQAWGATVPREILKTYFEKGDKPTQAQFSNVIDSMISLIDDRHLLGLRTASDGGAALLDVGAVIGPADTFTPAAGLSDAWAGQNGFVGLSFAQNGQTYYGYLQITSGTPGATDLYPMAVEYFVFADQPGTAIMAATVPEPSSLLLAAVGGSGLWLAVWRRRKT